MSHTGRGIPGISGGAVSLVRASDVSVTTDSASWTYTYFRTGSITRLFQNSFVPLQKSLIKSSDEPCLAAAILDSLLLGGAMDAVNASDTADECAR